MARRRKGKPINGVLLLDKPSGMSSNRALQKARGLFEAQKAGHTGTLDPMATGLLPVLLGEATKFASYLLEADKRYIASLKLGQCTDTGDAEGQIIQERPVPVLESASIDAAVAQFTGDIEQVPPMFSALKYQGRPLYELAREGREIKREPRPVSVYHSVPFGVGPAGFSLDVTCSKGTYVRTLAMDIGEVLGCGAHLDALRRLRTGPFDASGMVTLEHLASLEDSERMACLMPMDVLIDHLPRVVLDSDQSARFCQGQGVRLENRGSVVDDDLVRVYDEHRLLGVALVEPTGRLAPKRLVNTAEST